MPAAPSHDANKDEERLTHVQTNVHMTGPGIHYSSVQHGDFFRAKSDEKSEMTSQLTVDSDVQYLHTYYLIHQRQTLMRKEQRNIDPNADQQESLVERPWQRAIGRPSLGEEFTVVCNWYDFRAKMCRTVEKDQVW